MSKSIITLLALALFNVFALLSSTTAISTAHAHGVRGLRPPSNQHVSASVRSLREEEGIETEKETETEIETETVPPVPLNIVGGQDASLNEFPYFVSFPDAKCGGTLVAEDRVLTSGGCIENHGVPATVFVGGLNATDGVEVAVACAKRHPDYRKTGETIFNDVAMLKLVEPVTGVTPVQFNPNRDYPPAVLDGTEGPVTTIGLGFINNAGTRANTLQKATMTLVGSEACKAYFEPGVIFENTHACAEATDIGFCGGKDCKIEYAE